MIVFLLLVQAASFFVWLLQLVQSLAPLPRRKP